ncbi:MAG: hypothetical protein IPJ10_02565 [Flavobacteriales bacterium]|nr:hypothetical protein [Flavobacteriales bacterium]
MDTVDAVDASTASTLSTRQWPKDLPAQAAALTEVLGNLAAPASVEEIAGLFSGKSSKKRVNEMQRLLETLAAVGRAVRAEGELWSSAD